MTNEAEKLLAEAMKSVGLRGSFMPTEIGAKAGLNKGQAEAAARALSNAGILVLGFDNAAHFSSDYRKAKAPAEAKAKAEGKAKKAEKAEKKAKRAAKADDAGEPSPAKSVSKSTTAKKAKS